AIVDMQEDLVQLRQAVARSIAEQKRTEQQYNKNQTEANNWQKRAQLALSKGDENLAREALVRKKTNSDTAATLKTQLDQQTNQVNTLKRNLVALEGKISEAKTKKNMLKARAQAAKANEKLQQTMGSINTSGSLAAFERMEQKVLEMEARSEAAHELGGADLESQFRLLEGNDVDDELATMKAQLAGGSVSQEALPASQEKQSTSSDSPVDKELEDLRKQIDNL
ncbi:MAG: PspA/IM30 family protein, partial [Moorea sp. SIO3I7]|uniref:PspA/IM30 family protein n=1 Tax=Moorena sp. SIO3I8 TaxID=2607833 RepID=UPI0013C21BA8